MRAFMFELTKWEVVGIAALGVTLVALWLNWRRTAAIAQLEEDVKNGKITPDAAWHRSRFVHRRARAALVLGVALMLVFVAGLGF